MSSSPRLPYRIGRCRRSAPESATSQHWRRRMVDTAGHRYQGDGDLSPVTCRRLHITAPYGGHAG